MMRQGVIVGGAVVCLTSVCALWAQTSLVSEESIKQFERPQPLDFYGDTASATRETKAKSPATTQGFDVPSANCWRSR